MPFLNIERTRSANWYLVSLRFKVTTLELKVNLIHVECIKNGDEQLDW